VDEIAPAITQILHWCTKKLRCFRSVCWFWMFWGCWIKKWTQFFSIMSRFFATL